MNTSMATRSAVQPLREKAIATASNETGSSLQHIKSAIFLSGLSVFAQLYLFQPLLPLLSQNFNTTPAESSFTVSASTIGMAAGLFVLAFLADSLSRKRLMSFSLLASSIVTLATSLVHNFGVLVFLCFLKGLLVSGVSAVALAYLSEEVKPSKQGMAISLYLAGNTIGGMAGRIIVGFLSAWVSWQWCVFVIGLVSLGIGLVFIRLLPPSRNFEPARIGFRPKLIQMTSFLKDRLVIRLYFTGALLVGTFVSIYNYLGFRLESAVFHLPHYVVAFIFLMYAIGVPGSFAAARWTDRFSAQRVIKAFIFALIIALALLLTTNTIVLTIGLALLTFSFFGAHTIASRMVSQHAVVAKSTATSLYWLFYYIGSSFIGSSSGTVLHDYSWAFFIGSLLVIAGLSFLLTWQIKSV